MKKKQKNPNSERNTWVASYLISFTVHILLFLLLALLLAGRFGGSQRGGMTGGPAPIDIVVLESVSTQEARAETQPVTPRAQPEKKQPEKKAPEPEKQPEKTEIEPVKVPEPDRIVVPDEAPPEEVEPSTPQELPEETEPDETAAESSEPASRPETSERETDIAEVESSGEGGDTPVDTEGAGRAAHEGTSPGYGPFPDGSFGLGGVPDCKKNDANNESLVFKFIVEYEMGQSMPTLKPVPPPNVQYNYDTIRSTMIKIKESFNPSVLEGPNNLYRSEIYCRCGSKPECVMP